VFASLGIDGKVAEEALDKIGLTLNKNAVPNDHLPPFKPSGIRFGTPAAVTRGIDNKHMPKLADWMAQALTAHADEQKLKSLRKEVKVFARDFKLPSEKVN
jgi:glycine hydroxymethyltransferase